MPIARKSWVVVSLVGLAAAAIAPSCASSRQSTLEQPGGSGQMSHGSNAATGQMDHGGMDHSGMDTMSMDLGPADADFDLRFIDAMVLHHQGAVVMAEDAAQKSTRPEIQTLAAEILEAQAQEIAQMQQWRSAWYPNAGAEPVMFDAAMGHMMPMDQKMRDSMMMQMDLGPADDAYDRRFIDAMVPHHVGALEMAQKALDKSSRTEVKELAEAILSSQQLEIDQMNQWRQDWYGQ